MVFSLGVASKVESSIVRLLRETSRSALVPVTVTVAPSIMMLSNVHTVTPYRPSVPAEIDVHDAVTEPDVTRLLLPVSKVMEDPGQQ